LIGAADVLSLTCRRVGFPAATSPKRDDAWRSASCRTAPPAGGLAAWALRTSRTSQPARAPASDGRDFRCSRETFCRQSLEQYRASRRAPVGIGSSQPSRSQSRWPAATCRQAGFSGPGARLRPRDLDDAMLRLWRRRSAGAEVVLKGAIPVGLPRAVPGELRAPRRGRVLRAIRGSRGGASEPRGGAGLSCRRPRASGLPRTARACRSLRVPRAKGPGRRAAPGRPHRATRRRRSRRAMDWSRRGPRPADRLRTGRCGL
jgi:hypothetical protein